MNHAVQKRFQVAVVDHSLGGAWIQARLTDFLVRSIEQLSNAGFVAHAAGENTVAIEKNTQRLGLAELAASRALKTCAEKTAAVGDAFRPVDFWQNGRRIQRGNDGLFQILQTITARGDGFDHRHTKPLRQEIDLDANTIALGGVALVQSDQGRNAQFRALGDKEEVALEICGIKDKDQKVRLLKTPPPSEHIHHHPLVIRNGCEAVTAWQVEQIDIQAAHAKETGFFFHRDARIVRDVLAQAGEAVEKGGFARVGISHEGNQRAPLPQFRCLIDRLVHSAIWWT